MKKEVLKTTFLEAHESFVNYIDSLSEAQFLFSKDNEKWTAGQQMEHIGKSIGAVKKGYSMPKLVLKMTFGKANHPSRSYDELRSVAYERLLQPYDIKDTGVAPSAVTFDSKESNINRFRLTMQKLVESLNRFSEEELDHYVLPHPFLGKFTLREFMYFNIFHVRHHHQKVQENLKTFSEI